MKQFLRAIISAALAVTMFTGYVHANCCDTGCNDCGTTCPRCNTCCELKVDEAKEEKNCWKVECEEICVPRIVLPWQKSCCNPAANNGAYVKTIRVLKKHTYECPTCEYTWTPKASAGCASGCCAGGCGTCTDTGSATVIEQPPAKAPAEQTEHQALLPFKTAQKLRTTPDRRARFELVPRSKSETPVNADAAPVPDTIRPASFTNKVLTIKTVSPTAGDRSAPASAASQQLRTLFN